MPGMKIGYVRVSSVDQNPERQLDGLTLDKVFTDKASGATIKRPQLEAMLTFAREGDAIVVHSMDRLARNLADLRNLVSTLTARGVHVTFTKENLTFTGEDSPMANLLLSLMGAIADFERSLIKERQLEGISLAKQRGVYKGRKPALTDTQTEGVRERALAGEHKAKIARHYKVSRETVYKVLRAAKQTTVVGLSA